MVSFGGCCADVSPTNTAHVTAHTSPYRGVSAWPSTCPRTEYWTNAPPVSDWAPAFVIGGLFPHEAIRRGDESQHLNTPGDCARHNTKAFGAQEWDLIMNASTSVFAPPSPSTQRPPPPPPPTIVSQIRSIYNDLIDLASPRCPRENEFIVITREASANLVANRMFFAGPTPKFKPGGITWPKHPDGTPYRYDKGGIDVMWHTDTGKAPSFESNYTITGAELGPGDHKVYLTVTDQSWFINAPRQGVLQRMTMDTTFDIRVVDAKVRGIDGPGAGGGVARKGGGGSEG